MKITKDETGVTNTYHNIYALYKIWKSLMSTDKGEIRTLNKKETEKMTQCDGWHQHIDLM